ncbi:hypothetical protein KJ781_01430 [Patescibacteria group bacterium]|nr:hypothetical protein [Patescibacteria group bacterium]MBU1448930.1 hypothetical protein [Patescibacteria group bacterium]MBU2613157.1 hypothetical protein [Patescibacteria group bacterium]
MKKQKATTVMVIRRYVARRRPSVASQAPPVASTDEAIRRRDACLAIADELLFPLRRHLESEEAAHQHETSRLRDEIRTAKKRIVELERHGTAKTQVKRVHGIVIAISAETITRNVKALRAEIRWLEALLDAEMEPIRPIKADIAVLEAERRDIMRLCYERVEGCDPAPRHPRQTLPVTRDPEGRLVLSQH